MKIKIFGGTHGNEWTGAYLVMEYVSHFKAKYPNLDLEFIFSNPKAFKEKKRFIDEDLNRAFQFLNEVRPASFEHERAKELKNLTDQEPCFIIDLHTTTSNMGNTLIICQEEKLNFHVASFVKEKSKDCKIILSPDPEKKYLAGQSSFGLMIEVGPVANNILDGIILENTLHLLDLIFEALEKKNSLIGHELEVYEEIQDVYYPQDNKQDITAYIHPSLQGKDFQPVKGDFLSFKTFQGDEVVTKIHEELFPIFINEAAYYPSRLAFTLCKKRVLKF